MRCNFGLKAISALAGDATKIDRKAEVKAAQNESAKYIAEEDLQFIFHKGKAPSKGPVNTLGPELDLRTGKVQLLPIGIPALMGDTFLAIGSERISQHVARSLRGR